MCLPIRKPNSIASTSWLDGTVLALKNLEKCSMRDVHLGCTFIHLRTITLVVITNNNLKNEKAHQDNKSTKRCISGRSSNMLAYLRISLLHHQSGHSCWRHAKLEHWCRLAVGSHYQYTVHHPALSVHLPGQSRHWAVPVHLKTWYIMNLYECYVP